MSNPPKRPVIIANPDAAALLREKNPEKALQGAVPQARVELVEARSLTKAAQEAVEAGSRLVIAAGGDGTVNAVAAALVQTPAALGILPLGTMNHFARDVGLPVDVASAAANLAHPQIRLVDVGRVGGIFFVNNASFGLYPQVVERRDAIMEELRRGKWPAMVSALLESVKRAPTITASIELQGRSVVAQTPFVFVGNNPYQFEFFNLGGRQRLDTGRLGVYYSRRSGRAALMRLSWRAFTGRLAQETDFVAHETHRLRLDTPRLNVRVALDGEVHRLPTPIDAEILPAALRVAVPEVAA